MMMCVIQIITNDLWMHAIIKAHQKNIELYFKTFYAFEYIHTFGHSRTHRCIHMP